LRLTSGLSALFIGLSGGTAADRPDSAPKDDLAKLLGRWQVVSGERAGKPMTAKECEDFRVQIDELFLTYLKSDTVFRCRHTYAINPKADPKSIDLETVDTRALIDYRGIYVLDGDILKICIGQGHGKRSTEFATNRDGPGYYFYTLKRVPPAKK
jgi:uncharacterized protein (TIGR03067 family)